ncbi:hypothetical protein ABW20_dc0110362 [Dactylellina cionopaga]|nr:hypothetical protein ABW20_dc0110362 [Dactylellina cionopaga]
MDALTLYAQAQKLESSTSGGFGWFSGSKQDKVEAAIDAFVQAGNAFRTTGQGGQAGGCFEKAAALSKSINEPNDAANYHVEAFKCYQLTSPGDAAKALRLAIAHYALTNVRRAATHKQTLGELLEKSQDTKKEAIEELLQAGDWFRNDNAEALANKCFIKAADLHGDLGEYAEAIKLYEAATERSINNQLMKWSVKDYLFKAALCHLASEDSVARKRAILQDYPALEPAFNPPAMECLFLHNLLEAVETQEPEAFFEHVMQYKERYPLDNWKLNLLEQAQKNIPKEELI